jgi:hypothetical protein
MYRRFVTSEYTHQQLTFIIQCTTDCVGSFVRDWWTALFFVPLGFLRTCTVTDIQEINTALNMQFFGTSSCCGQFTLGKNKYFYLKKHHCRTPGEWNNNLHQNHVRILWLDMQCLVILSHSMSAQVTTNQCSMTPQTGSSTIPSKEILKLLLSVVQKCCKSLWGTFIN